MKLINKENMNLHYNKEENMKVDLKVISIILNILMRVQVVDYIQLIKIIIIGKEESYLVK